MRTQDDAVKSLIQLAERAYNTAYQKGFWEEPRSEETLLMLMVSELSEALEEVRNNEEVMYFRGEGGTTYSTDQVVLSQKKHYFQPIYSTDDAILKPEGLAIEIADYMIRILDLLGSETTGINMGNFESVLGTLFNNSFGMELSGKDDSDKLFTLTRCTVLAGEQGYPTGHLLARGLVLAYKFLEGLNMDPIETIGIKMDYNDTRGYKHGKAF